MKSTFNFTIKQASSAFKNRATEVMNCYIFTCDKLVANRLSPQGDDNCNLQATVSMLHGSIAAKIKCILVN
jgi:hypothetical protein